MRIYSRDFHWNEHSETTRAMSYVIKRALRKVRTGPVNPALVVGALAVRRARGERERTRGSLLGAGAAVEVAHLPPEEEGRPGGACEGRPRGAWDGRPGGA